MTAPKKKTPATTKTPNTPAKKSAPKKKDAPVQVPVQDVPRAREVEARLLDPVALARRMSVPLDGPGSAPLLVSAHDIPKEERGKLYEGGALCPEMRSLESLLEMKARNPRVFENQQMGFSSQLKGNIYQRGWFGRFSRSDLENTQFVAIILSYDPAFTVEDTSDYTVMGAFGITRDGWIYMFSRVKGKWTSVGVEDEVSTFYNRNGLIMAVAHNCDHLIVGEDVGGGKTVLQHLNATTTLPILAIKNPFQKSGPDKTQSAKAMLAYSIGAPFARTGRILLPDYEDWTHDFLEVLAEFPMGRHDDDVDMLQLALLKLCESQIAIMEEIMLSGGAGGRVVVEGANDAARPALPAPKEDVEVFDCAFEVHGEWDNDIPEIGY